MKHECSDTCPIHCLSEPTRALLAAEMWADSPHTQSEAASHFGIDVRRLREAKTVLKSGHADLVERVREGGSLNGALAEVRARRSRVGVPDEDNPEIRRGEFTEVLADIQDKSVSAIVTDVPWPPVMDVYDRLAVFAERVLVPGGVCAALVGQRYLFDLTDALRARLSPLWQFAYVVAAGYDGGACVRVWHYPVVVFTNGPRRFGLESCSDVVRDNVSDVIEAVPGDKSRHEYAKSVDGMAEIVKRVSEPGDLVVDPFAGSGSVGYAALRNGRRFLGSDIRAV